MDISTLDKNSSEQLYLQVRRLVVKAIRNQDLLPRQKLPSATELSKVSGVSRMTVRQALQALVNEGWLYTVPGKGTFVAESPRIEQNLQHLMGWTQEIRMQGFQPSTRLILSDIVIADRTIAEKLALTPGKKVYRIVRVRYADNYPLAFERAHLSCDRFPGLNMLINADTSLYQVLRENFDVYPVRATQILEAAEADPQAAELLEIAVGKPVLLSERIAYSSGDEPVEYVTAMHRPGFVRFRTELNAGSANIQQIIVKPDGQLFSGG